MERLNYQADVARKKQEAFFNAQKKEIEDKFDDKNYERELNRKHTGKVNAKGAIEEKQPIRTATPSYLASETTKQKAISSPIKAPPSEAVRLDSQ